MNRGGEGDTKCSLWDMDIQPYFFNLLPILHPV